MGDAEKTIECPACAHEFAITPGTDLSTLTCPRCEAEIPKQAARGEEEIVEEIAPGFRPGQRLGGNYVIESLLGSGGMAVVFRGRQLSLNRHVAIKILPKEFAKKPMFVERFESEAAVLASLNHPNIVSVIDRGLEGETYFIVMEYIEGETLKERLTRKGRLTADEIFPLARQTLAGLIYAHQQGVVHRDVKPGNIMINKTDVVKLADFGLAHLAKAQGGLDVTRDNQAMGTLKYMAPEQLASAKDVDGRADIYSFGVCIYEALTGRLPLGMFKLPSEIDPSLDARWDDVILCSLKMEPEDRYRNAGEMAAVLQELSSTPRVTHQQREQEEEEAATKKADMSLTACAGCGNENPPTARTCRQCGEGLDDLFDKCPECGHENRVDIPACAQCRADLQVHRHQLRREAESIQARAKQLSTDHKFDDALVELERLLEFNTREYAAIRENARLWIERVERRRTRYLQQIYEAGQRMIAEARFDRALQLWEPLPDDYRDVGTQRRHILEHRKEAATALKEAQRLYKLRDLAAAIQQFEIAIKYWPQNPKILRRLERARNKLGNQRLKASYFREARRAEKRQNFTEAIALGHRILELDPDDKEALEFLKQVEAAEREAFQRRADSDPEIIMPQRPGAPERAAGPSRVLIGVIAGAVALVVLVFLILAVVIPGARNKRAREAQAILEQAVSLRKDHKLKEALARATDVVDRYPKTLAAESARKLIEEVQTIRLAAHDACDRVNENIDKDSLESLTRAFSAFSELIETHPAVSITTEYRQHAQERREDVRGFIADKCTQLGADHETRYEWRDALKRYRLAFEEYECTDDPIASRLREALRRVDGCDKHLENARSAVEASRWDQAVEESRAALDLIHIDADAHELLARVIIKATPPDGMVLVPPGKYIVGGAEGRPGRTVHLPHGLFIDRTEVSNERYGEFLRATDHRPPPGWSEDGRAPLGKEKLPVVNVTWHDAAAFAQWAECTLPTEDLWECAVRGPSGKRYPWGNGWNPTAAVLGFGPTAAGVASKDLTFCGCVDMAGNVAEWTASQPKSTKLNKSAGRVQEPIPEPRRDEEPPPPDRDRRTDGPRPPNLPNGKNRRRSVAAPVPCVVKGSSWAGFEDGRPTVPVPHYGGADTAGPERILTPNPDVPQRLIGERADIVLGYIGAPSPGHAYVVVSRWMPQYRIFVSRRFPLPIGEPIGSEVSVTVMKGKTGQERARVKVDFSTGCVAVGQEARKWLDVRYPSGAVRRLPFLKTDPQLAPKVVERQAPAKPDLLAEDAALASARMIGRSDQRYLNVGFRCSKAVWTPPKAKPAVEKKEAPEKKGDPGAEDGPNGRPR